MLRSLNEVRFTVLPQRHEGLISAISTLGHLLEQRLDQTLSAVGLTARQYRALCQIAEMPGISRAALARALHVTPQAAGGLTQRLYGASLIERSGGDPGLPISFTITEVGEEHLERSGPIVAATELRVMATLSTETIESLAEGISELFTAVGYAHPTTVCVEGP